LASLPRSRMAEQALKNYGTILIVKNLTEAARMINALAPEYLELAVMNPFQLLMETKNTGAIFLGHISPEAIGG